MKKYVLRWQFGETWGLGWTEDQHFELADKTQYLLNRNFSAKKVYVIHDETDPGLFYGWTNRPVNPEEKIYCTIYDIVEEAENYFRDFQFKVEMLTNFIRNKCDTYCMDDADDRRNLAKSIIRNFEIEKKPLL